MMDNRKGKNNHPESYTFLFASINDMQNTIRALDGKFNFILVILIIPISQISPIYHVLYSLILKAYSTCIFIIYLLFISLFFLSWLFSFIFTILGLSSIDNPVKHIKEPIPPAKGLFYLGGIFSFNLFNNTKIISNISHKELLNEYKSENFSILHELSLEQLKLSYIRDIKIFRQKLSYLFMVIWIFCGLLIYIVYRIFT